MHSSGRISVCIQAEQELSGLIPHDWKDYLAGPQDSARQITLRLQTAANLERESCLSGWSVQQIDGCRQIVYAPGERPYFSMKYEPSADTMVIYVRSALDAFVRTAVQYGLMIALHQTCVGLHGVTLQCAGQTVILSAPSGTGKTTLAHLLEEHCGARVINGDFALLSAGGNEAMFEPTPFCGTSQVCLNERLKADRIVFLSQSKENEWKDLDGRQSLTHMLSNCFVPSFDREIGQAIQENILRILAKVKVSGFSFAPNSEAAQLFLNNIMHDERN